MDDNQETTGWDRRTMIKGAAGLGAATAVASVLTTSQTASAAVGLRGILQGIGEFNLLAFSWGASSVGSGQGGPGRAVGKPALQDLSLTKYTDANSPKILDALLRNKLIPTASITVTPSGFPVIVYALENVLVSSYSSGGSGGEDQLTENLSLNFTKLTYTVGSDSVDWP